MQSMRAPILLALAAIAASCSPKSETPAPVQEPKPVANQVGTPSTVPNDTAQSSGQKPPVKDPRHNDLRLYQLSELKVVDLSIGSHKFKAWVMDTASKRQEGMMHLQTKDVRDNEAMLFVFSEAQEMAFWMQNTPLPLDILYVSENFKVLNIAHGKPYDETSLPSIGKAKFVVELKEGTSKKLGIKAGAVVKFPPGITADS